MYVGGPLLNKISTLNVGRIKRVVGFLLRNGSGLTPKEIAAPIFFHNFNKDMADGCLFGWSDGHHFERSAVIGMPSPIARICHKYTPKGTQDFEVMYGVAMREMPWPENCGV